MPDSYLTPALEQGRVETVTYDTRNYSGDGHTETKNALVYLPFGYDDDASMRYDILYLIHGAGGSYESYLNSDFKDILDHMISDQVVEPLIVVTPDISRGDDGFTSGTADFPTEVIADLIPAVEGRYRTYAESTTPEGQRASRAHRAIGGFSLGAYVTWTVFSLDLDSFEYFIPMSCNYSPGSWDISESSEESARLLAAAALDSPYADRGYYIYTASGSEDFLCESLYLQVQAMRAYPDAFTLTDDFDSGNLMFYLGRGSRHSYLYSPEYLYNGLPLLFRESRG